MGHANPKGKVDIEDSLLKNAIHTHQRRNEIHPELSGRIAMHFNGNTFAQIFGNEWQFVWIGVKTVQY